MMPPFFKKITPDAMIRRYNSVHAIGNTQVGGVNGDLLRDLYHFEFAEFIVFCVFMTKLNSVEYNYD
jgi:hypothetical protein